MNFTNKQRYQDTWLMVIQMVYQGLEDVFILRESLLEHWTPSNAF